MASPQGRKSLLSLGNWTNFMGRDGHNNNNNNNNSNHHQHHGVNNNNNGGGGVRNERSGSSSSRDFWSRVSQQMSYIDGSTRSNSILSTGSGYQPQALPPPPPLPHAHPAGAPHHQQQSYGGGSTTSGGCSPPESRAGGSIYENYYQYADIEDEEEEEEEEEDAVGGRSEEALELQPLSRAATCASVLAAGSASASASASADSASVRGAGTGCDGARHHQHHQQHQRPRPGRLRRVPTVLSATDRRRSTVSFGGEADVHILVAQKLLNSPSRADAVCGQMQAVSPIIGILAVARAAGRDAAAAAGSSAQLTSCRGATDVISGAASDVMRPPSHFCRGAGDADRTRRKLSGVSGPPLRRHYANSINFRSSDKRTCV
ncbi:probable serine/threonine-protein kinase DDB_G0271402 [Schistocerca piceifrons]|uniref:probable serine/threonine-protein kinase DDB_G0271402 n=1 Tax=Schistocerca piceifrons TaxID=274613 RepID=UPI001F5F4410|nr:probable serine/threonine-protein kinase DDB_G0271402 [Schistocerca piceifrons]